MIESPNRSRRELLKNAGAATLAGLAGCAGGGSGGSGSGGNQDTADQSDEPTAQDDTDTETDKPTQSEKSAGNETADNDNYGDTGSGSTSWTVGDSSVADVERMYDEGKLEYNPVGGGGSARWTILDPSNGTIPDGEWYSGLFREVENVHGENSTEGAVALPGAIQVKTSNIGKLLEGEEPIRTVKLELEGQSDREVEVYDVESNVEEVDGNIMSADRASLADATHALVDEGEEFSIMVYVTDHIVFREYPQETPVQFGSEVMRPIYNPAEGVEPNSNLGKAIGSEEAPGKFIRYAGAPYELDGEIIENAEFLTYVVEDDELSIRVVDTDGKVYNGEPQEF